MSTDAPHNEPDARTVLDRYAAAWVAGDLVEIIGCYHDDFTLHYLGANALTGTHSGKPAALKVLAEFTQRTNRRLVAIVAVAAGTTSGALIARELLGPDDTRIEVERILAYAVRDGLLAECWVHDADQPAIDRLIGPSPVPT